MITYITSGVCATEIQFAIESGIIKEVRFSGGCQGNLTAISKLVQGMPVKEVIQKLRGIPCEDNQTSCADQLARALEQFAE
ncbi:conserved hypothetical protein [Thermosinus carboxydivorans Nor1]|uniref:ribonucleoside-diphosphate reductase n=1 Tax=Thermosinus carboxydivorans Nor1 TaxID=401526 RepID=A1HQC7_9FIRM|nr:TIGR03905 family TSCPD domain-containing protein [Thermosinus carboxydivorans]EAX47734.1 conserved hypothetical protein [Thermosinus carboxydivorans Nor1]